MCRIFYILLLLVTTLFASCEVEMPEDIIPQDKMESLLYDYHLAQSMSSEYTSADYKEKLFFCIPLLASWRYPGAVREINGVV